MDANNEAIARSEEKLKDITQALEDLAGTVADGGCNDPNTNLFDEDVFWMIFNFTIARLVRPVKDNQKMD